MAARRPVGVTRLLSVRPAGAAGAAWPKPSIRVAVMKVFASVVNIAASSVFGAFARFIGALAGIGESGMVFA